MKKYHYSDFQIHIVPDGDGYDGIFLSIEIWASHRGTKNGGTQRIGPITSGGLWGIENADPAYVNEIVEQELENLNDLLAFLNLREITLKEFLSKAKKVNR